MQVEHVVSGDAKKGDVVGLYVFQYKISSGAHSVCAAWPCRKGGIVMNGVPNYAYILRNYRRREAPGSK